MKTTTKYLLAVPAALLGFMLVLIAFPDATRAMSRLLGYMPGAGLVEQAPPEQTVYPMVELTTPTPAPAAEEKAAASATPKAEPERQELESKLLTPADIFLSLTGNVPLEDGALLYGSLQPNREDVVIGMVDSSALHLVDAGGQAVYLEEDTTSERTYLPGSNKYYLTYRTTDILTSGPATFTIDSVWVDQKVQASFVFNPGANPQPGQTWPLNVDVAVAGHTLRIASVKLGPTGSGLAFIFDPTSEIQSAMLTDLDHPLAPTGGGGGSGSGGFAYADGLPNQPIQVSVTQIFFEFAGPWQTTVELQATATATATAAAPSARSSAVCLTHDSWKKALANKQSSLPDGLTGKLAISFFKAGDYYYQVMATSLDGSDRQDIGYGDWPGLSPDGSILVYTGQTGLVLVDLATDQSTPIAGTGIYDRGVVWSPDGKQFAFTRGPASGLIGAPGPYNIWTADADGSNLHEVTSGNNANTAMAWMPTGDRILYTVAEADGAYVRTINLQTGDVVPLFETNYTHSTIALSPDGKQAAFEEMLPGDRYAIFIADLDGSNRRLLTNSSPVVATVPLWSPDGRWIAVGVTDPDANPPLPVLTLIEVDTCQTVPLPHLNGYGYTWTR